MKMLKISHKVNFGIITKYYSFKEILSLEFDDKFTFIKLYAHLDKIDGMIEKFDLEKWEKFVTSNEKTIFEICIG